MKLTREQAIERLIERDRVTRKKIARLMAWDSEKTINENCISMNISYLSNASAFKTMYCLESKESKHIGVYSLSDVVKDSNKISTLRKMGYTMPQIGLLYGVSRQRIEQILKKVGK